MHVNYSPREDTEEYLGYDFWMHHHHLIESVNRVTSIQLTESNSMNPMAEPDILCLSMHAKAVMICVHHAAMIRVGKTQTPPSLSSDGESRCLQAATEISDIARLVCHLDVAKVSSVLAVSSAGYSG